MTEHKKIERTLYGRPPGSKPAPKPEETKKQKKDKSK